MDETGAICFVRLASTDTPYICAGDAIYLTAFRKGMLLWKKCSCKNAQNHTIFFGSYLRAKMIDFD